MSKVKKSMQIILFAYLYSSKLLVISNGSWYNFIIHSIPAVMSAIHDDTRFREISFNQDMA